MQRSKSTMMTQARGSVFERVPENCVDGKGNKILKAAKSGGRITLPDAK
jgi:hypothetical protein